MDRSQHTAAQSHTSTNDPESDGPSFSLVLPPILYATRGNATQRSQPPRTNYCFIPRLAPAVYLARLRRQRYVMMFQQHEAELRGSRRAAKVESESPQHQVERSCQRLRLATLGKQSIYGSNRSKRSRQVRPVQDHTVRDRTQRGRPTHLSDRGG